ncbi:FlgD immunoglobulin-like domain containing protein, partial [Candidatus Eisenbacteria bacterium]
INVVAYDGAEQKVFESGGYDFIEAELVDEEDDQLKVYEIHPGTSPALAAAIGFPPGKSFHFVLSDTVYFDNRIPPRGSTYATLLEVQSPPVDYIYADGQYWDDTEYHLPVTAEQVEVTLYYQSTSKEYIEFLRDENTTNSAGQDLYNAWVAQGKCPPEVMAQASTPVAVIPTAVEERESGVSLKYSLSQAQPNPFDGSTTIRYSLGNRTHVEVAVYDVRGRRVRTMVDGVQDAGDHRLEWNGADQGGQTLGSGIYFMRYEAAGRVIWRKATLLR